jgi:hypothetical protein
LKYTNTALQRIFEESGGHPFLARQLCSQVWEQLRDVRHSNRIIEIDEKEIGLAVRAYLKDGRCSAYHEQTWETRLTEREQVVVKRLAQADEPLARIKGERTALNSLTERHVVIEEGEKYHISFGLFKRWIRLNILDFREE